MSLGVSARLKYPKKHDLVKSHSQSQILASKLRQDGVMSAVENVMQAVDQVAAVLASTNMDPAFSYKDTIINLCQHLKVYGAYLEVLYQDQLNRAFIVFRNSSQDDIRLDYLSRLHLLELIELRAKGWKGTDVMNQYYRKKIEASESVTSMTESLTSLSISSATTTAAPLLGPGEIIKPSGKFSKPTRIPGKNYCKDEVVIRNADSGKVMGIKGRRVHMIEELSETIISFQRVSPGAKERLVQITGANEESIIHAKQLIEDTIRRNASPVRDSHGGMAGGPLTGSSSSINSSASEENASSLPQSNRTSRALLHSLSTNDASLGEYKYTVVTGGHTIKITGDNLDLVRTSKLVLDEYFSGEPLQDVAQFYSSFDSLPHPIIAASNEIAAPLSPPESIPSPSTVNGQTEETAQVPLRRPHSFTEGNKERSPSTSDKGDAALLRRPHSSLSFADDYKGPDFQPHPIRNHYSIEHLARLALSPLCLLAPIEWDRISGDYPTLVRKVIEQFDAKQYLVNRAGDFSNTVLSATDIDSGEV